MNKLKLRLSLVNKKWLQALLREDSYDQQLPLQASICPHARGRCSPELDLLILLMDQKPLLSALTPLYSCDTAP